MISLSCNWLAPPVALELALPLCHPRELITVAKPALCLDGDLSEDIPNNSPINCKKYLAKFGPAPKRSPFGAETNPLTRSPLDNLEDGLLAWVILVVLLLVVEPSSVSFLSVPENATENRESSPKSLNSEAGSALRWGVL